jgi:hypothetical protein
VPGIIDYAVVLARLTEGGLRCNYPNSGAFGFAPAAEVLVRGWIAGPDSSIKPELARAAQIVANPAEAAARAWQAVLAGPVWIMPASHWHFELHDGSRDWLAGVLGEIGVDAKTLENRADGSAIESGAQEVPAFTRLLAALLENLRVSDFTLAFPGRPVICLAHHHKQLWWTSTDAKLLEQVSQAGR